MSVGRVTSAQVRRELIRMDQKTARKRAWIGLLVVLATALLAGTLASRFLFALADVRTSGMGGILESGDVVLCERMASPLRQLELERGSLALVKYLDVGMQKQTLRRVIALAGDEVSVEADGHVTVNGEALDEPYASYRQQGDWSVDSGEITPGGALENPFAEPDEVIVQTETVETDQQVDDVKYPLVVPSGQLFVLCDDRENVLDSRSSRFGMVNEGDVLGLARLVLWPAHRAAILEDGRVHIE